MVLKYLVEKEFRQIMRTPLFILLMVYFPLVMLLLIPWATTFEVRDVRLAVVDRDASSYAQRLIAKLNASTQLAAVECVPDYQSAYAMVEQRKVDGIIELPPHFGKALAAGQSPRLLCAFSAVDGTKALLASNAVAAMVHQFTLEVQCERAPSGGVLPCRIEPIFRFNPQQDYKVFMLPALIVMLITLVCGLLAVLNIVQEKERGTIYQINVTPVSRFQFILAKIIPYWGMGIVIFTGCIGLMGWVYHLWPVGSTGLAYFSTIVYILTISGMGIVMSNYSSTLQQATFLMLFYMLILFLMSGLFTNIETMPIWAQVVAYANPLTYYIDLLRSVYLRGSDWADLAPQLLRLTGFAVLFNVWAVLSYKKVA